MTDPFDAIFEDVEVKEKSEWTPVVDSELECERCYRKSDRGEYSFTRKALRWTCPQGHKNIVAPLEILDDGE